MKKHLAIPLAVLLAVICLDFHLAAATYRPFPLPGGTFDDTLEAWPLTAEYSVGPWGKDGGQALKCERTKNGYAFMARPISLTHGRSYRLGWWMKIEGELPGEGVAVSIDWFADGSWVSFTMLKLTRSTGGEWLHCTGEFTAPSNPDFTFALLAYLRNGTLGTVYFDDFTLEEIVGEANVYPLNVSNGKIQRSMPLDMCVFVSGDMPVREVEMAWKDNAGQCVHQCTLPVVDGHVLADIGDLPCGDYTAEMRPVPEEDGIDFPMFCHKITIEDEPSARVRIDPLGRCLVDGKPFMPLGWFVAGISRNWEDGNTANCNLEFFKNSPFNTVMPYNGLHLPASELTGIEGMREALDACREAGVMVVYSLKDYYPADKPNLWQSEKTNRDAAAAIVNGLKSHPALLAWYTSDEMPKNMVPEILERHAMVNRLDPDHPAWALFCSYADLPFFGGCFDVLGIDPYPINSPMDSGIFSVAQALEDTRKAFLRANGSMALWAVPQAFNAALYNSKDEISAEDFFNGTRCPTAEESLAMALLHAIHGARGFIFYSDFDLRKSHENLRYESRWRELCETGQILKDLEPFIMAASPRPAVTVTQTTGRVDAALMRSDDGNLALLIVSPLKEGGQADLQGDELPPGMISKFGHTIETAPGIYRFCGGPADYDILLTDTL